MLGITEAFVDENVATHAPCGNIVTLHVDLDDHMAARPDELTSLSKNMFEAKKVGVNWCHHPIFVANTEVHTFLAKEHNLAFFFTANLVALRVRQWVPLNSVR
jgi:hypothetical protein